MSRSQKWWCLLLWAAFVLSPRAWSQPPTPPEPKPLEDKLPRTDSDGGPLPPHALARLGILSFRHRGFVAAPFVEAVAFSADGKTLATLGGDGSVCIWEASTGRFMRQFGYRIPKGLSYHLSFSSDGQKLAVRAGMESNVWDVATGKEIPLRRPWRDPNIFSIVFAPDGKILALEQNTIYLRETATDKDIRTLARKDGGGFSAMLFSPDGKMLLGSAPSSWRHAIYFWDASTGEEIRKIEANEYYTRAPRLALSPDGKVLATGGSPIHLWEVATGKELGVIKNAGEQFTFSPDSKTLASWGAFGEYQVNFHDVATGTGRGKLEGFFETRPTFAYAPDSRTAVINDDHWGNLRRIDLLTKEETVKPTGQRAAVQHVACSADGHVVASAGADQTVRVWDPATGKERQCISVGERGGSALAISPDGKLLAVADEGVGLWDLSTGRQIIKFGAEQSISALAFSPNGKQLAVGSTPPALWDVATGKEVGRLASFRPNYLAFSPDGGVLATDGIKLWDAATGKELPMLGEHLNARPFAFSPDGKMVAVALDLYEIQIYERATRKLRLRWQAPTTTAVAFSPDGRLLAGATDRSIVFWDPLTGDELLRLDGHQKQVTSLVFAPEGRTLLSGSADGTALIWEVPSLRLASRAAVTPITKLPIAKALLRLEAVEKSDLLAALEHPEPEIRCAALQKIAPLAAKDETLLGLLREGLRDKDDKVRIAASQALFQAGREEKATGPVHLVRQAEPAASAPNDRPALFDRYGDPLPPGALARLGTNRLRHAGLTAMAFSPDAKRLASDGDGTVRLWDVSSGQEISRWLGDPRLSSGPLSFTPDGKTVLSSDFFAIHCRDVATGKELRKIEAGDRRGVIDFALSPDGKLVALNNDGAIILVDALTGKHLRRTASYGLGSLAFSEDSRLLQCGGTVWEAATGKEVVAVSAGDEVITSATLSPDGKTLATSHGDNSYRAGFPVRFAPSVRLWDVATGKLLHHFKEDRRCIDRVVYSPDGKLLAVTGDDTSIRLWDAASGKEVSRLLGSYAYPDHVRFSPDGKLLAAADGWNRLLIWELSSGQRLHSFHKDEGFILTVAYSPDGKTIATAGDSTIRLRAATTGKTLRELRGHQSLVPSLAYTPDGKQLFSGGGYWDGTTRIWDPETGKELRKYNDNGGSVAVSADGKYLVSGKEPLRLREIASGKEIASFDYREIHCLSFSPSGNRLAVGEDVWKANVYEVPTGQEFTRFGVSFGQHPGCQISALAHSPDSSTLACLQPTLGLNFLHIDSRTGKRSRYQWEDSEKATAMAYSTDGKTLAVGCWDGLVSLCDPETAREQARFVARQGEVKAVAFSPDGQTLTAVYGDGSALVWEIKGPQSR